jgi:histidine triad (HIT) family protein
VEKDCIFCKIAAGEFNTQFVFENDELVAFRDIRPQAPVHILIIPRRHIERINQLTDSDVALVGNMVLAANQLAKNENISDSGYRLVFNCGRDSGQEVEHIHLHLFGGRKMSWPPG